MSTLGIRIVEPSPSSLGASRLLNVSAEEFLGTGRAGMEAAKATMAHFKSAARTPSAGVDASEAILDIFDAAFAALQNVGARCGLAHEVHPDEKLRAAAETCEQEVSALATEFSLDREIYDALQSVDLTHVDANTRYFVEKNLRDFRLGGVDRDPETRAQLKELNQELVKIGQEFSKNIRDDDRRLAVDPADLDGLPEDFRRAHPPGPNGKVSISTDTVDYYPVLTYAHNAKTREALWRLYLQRAHPQNLQVLTRMLEARFRVAQLLGFDNWADYITQDKMIGNEKNAGDFIARIAGISQARADHDYQDLLAIKRGIVPTSSNINAWDHSYLMEKLKVERYGFDSQAVRPYFEYSRVKQGVLDITSTLFGIAYRRVQDAQVWHSDVETYDIYPAGDHQSKALGRIYLDMFPRENKYKHFAQFNLMNGNQGSTQSNARPEGVLVCNFPRPGADSDGPGLMEYRDVRTLFHEFGHLLHHVFGGRIRWATLSGTAVQMDFVEVPSQLLEEWTRDAGSLQVFARHYQTGDPIPARLVEQLRAADDVGRGATVRQQMFYAALSLGLYNRDPEGLDTTSLLAELQSRYTPYPYVEGTYLQESFGHLDGYSALYYTYMWSLVIAKDMFNVFQTSGLLNSAVAGKYRSATLEPGGSKPAAQLVENFLGRPYSFDAYESWLNEN